MNNIKRKNRFSLNNKRRKNNLNKGNRKKKLFFVFIFLHVIFFLSVAFVFTFIIPAKFSEYGVENTSVYDKIKYVFTRELPKGKGELKEHEDKEKEIYRTYNDSSLFDKNSYQKEEDVRNFVTKYKNKLPNLSLISLESSNNIIYYKKDGTEDIVPKKLYFDDLEFYQNEVVNYLLKQQSEFDQESRSVLQEFQSGSNKKKIDLLSSDRGKTHLIYRYHGDPGYDSWFDNDYLILKLYYDPKKDEDIVAKVLDYVVEYAKDRGNILTFDLIGINDENAAILEDVQYSGDVVAVAEKVRITKSYGISNDYVKTNKINITNNAEDINNLIYYFDNSKSN
jgi:hypothetical protein